MSLCRSMCLPVLCLFFFLISTDAFGQTTFSLADFMSAIKARIASTGQRDTIYKRVPAGQSCVQASDARASEIATVVKSMQYYGRFGLFGAKVGRTSGWNPLAIVPEETRKKYIGETASGSMHTYTVVQVYDGTGKVYYTIDADNYLGSIYVSEHGSVNWSADHTQLIEDVPPIIKSVKVSNLPTAMAGDMVNFRAFVNAEPWVMKNLKYKWMLVNGTKLLGYGDSMSLRLDYPAVYNMKVMVYHDNTGQEVVLAEAVGTITVIKAQLPDGTGRRYTSKPLPLPDNSGTGRRYTSKAPGVPGVPSIDTTNPVKGIFDALKKAGDFFGK